MGAPRIKDPREYIRSHTALFYEDGKSFPLHVDFSHVRGLYYAKCFNLSAYGDSEEQAVANLRTMIRNVRSFVDNAEFFLFFDKESRSFIAMAGQLVGKRKDKGGAILSLRDQICRNAENLPSMLHIDTSDPVALLRRIVFSNPYPDFDGKIFLDETTSKLAGEKRYVMENGDLSTSGASRLEAARKFDFRIGMIRSLLDSISISFSGDQGVISISGISPPLAGNPSFTGKTKWEALFALGIFIKEEAFVAETESFDWESVDDGEVAGDMS